MVSKPMSMGLHCNTNGVYKPGELHATQKKATKRGAQHETGGRESGVM